MRIVIRTEISRRAPAMNGRVEHMRTAFSCWNGLLLSFLQLVDQTFDMLLDRIALGGVALILRHVVPAVRFPARGGVCRQTAANREDVRGGGHISGCDRGRPGGRQR